MESNDMLYNWTGALRKNESGERYVAASTASDLKEQGYNSEQALELMVADNYDLRLASSVVDDVFELKIAQVAETPIYKEYVVPASYRDVAPIIEDALMKTSSCDFVDKLYGATDNYGNGTGILNIKAKYKDSWNRLAHVAKESSTGMASLHCDLRPYIEEAMLDSVEKAEYLGKNKLAKVIVEQDKERYTVASKQDGKSRVSLEDGTCSCEKSQAFAEFGLACEHLILAALTIYPTQRLIKNSAIG